MDHETVRSNAYRRSFQTTGSLLVQNMPSPAHTTEGTFTMLRQRSSAGFTLIELMIVVAIIAILAAIAIPAYQDYAVRAQVSEGMSLSTGAKAAVWDFLSNTGRLPPSNGSAGLAQPSSINGSYVSSVDASNGRILIAFKGPKANAAISNQSLILSPITYTGSITWTCTKSTLAARYLPSACR